MKTVEQRFDAKWMPEPMSGCWLWFGANDGADGYGCFRTTGIEESRAHRLSYMRFVGEIPDGLEVMHTCDTPACVNPDHLVVGTHAQNMADASQKGRMRGTPYEKQWMVLRPQDRLRGDKNWARQNPHLLRRGEDHHWHGRRQLGDENPSRKYPERRPRGEAHCHAKLTADDVAEIRRLRSAGWSQQRIADKFSVSQPTISWILLGRGWRHVTNEVF